MYNTTSQDTQLFRDSLPILEAGAEMGLNFRAVGGNVSNVSVVSVVAMVFVADVSVVAIVADVAKSFCSYSDILTKCQAV